MGLWDDVKKKAADSNIVQSLDPRVGTQKTVEAVKSKFSGDTPGATKGNPYVAPDTKAQDFASQQKGKAIQGIGGDMSDLWHKVIGAGAGGAGAGGAPNVNFADALNKSMGKPSFADQYLPGAINQLQDSAAGKGPGAQLAQNMVNKGEREGALRTASQIASTKGVNPGMAAKMAGDQMAAANQNAVQQGANFGLQDQMHAQDALGNVINQGTAGQNQNLQALISGNTGQAQAAATLAASQNAARAGMFGGILNAAGGLAGNKGLMDRLFGSGGAGAAGAAQGFGPDATTTGSGVAVDSALPTATDIATSTSLNGNSLTDNSQNRPPPGVPRMHGFGKMYSHGGKVEGTAQVRGDSPKNDTVDAKLSPGEIVIPRTASEDPDKAHKFVSAIMDKKSKRKGYGGVLQAKRELEELKNRMSTLESRIGGRAS